MPNPFANKASTGTAAAAVKAAPAADDTTDDAPAAPPAKKAAAKAAPAQRAKPAAKAQGGDGFDSVDDKGGHVAGKAADPFSTPAGVSEYKITDLVGALMLVKPTEVIEEMTTDIGLAENVVRADVVVLNEITLEDGTVMSAGHVVEDILVFQMALKRALLRVLDGPNPFLLGWLGRGTAKKGKDAPYIFERPDDDDAQVARDYLKTVS